VNVQAVGIQAGLLNTMHNDGVGHIIYLGYHHLGVSERALDYPLCYVYLCLIGINRDEGGLPFM
jgi:hypothetical protein